MEAQKALKVLSRYVDDGDYLLIDGISYTSDNYTTHVDNISFIVLYYKFHDVDKISAIFIFDENKNYVIEPIDYTDRHTYPEDCNNNLLAHHVMTIEDIKSKLIANDADTVAKVKKMVNIHHKLMLTYDQEMANA